VAVTLEILFTHGGLVMQLNGGVVTFFDLLLCVRECGLVYVL